MDKKEFLLRQRMYLSKLLALYDERIVSLNKELQELDKE